MNDAIEVTRLALRLAQVEQQNIADRIAHYQSGPQAVELYDFAPLMSQLQQANAQQRAVIAQQTQDLEQHKQVVIAEASLDELVAQSSMVAGKYNALIEGLNRQLGLMSIVLNGGKR